MNTTMRTAVSLLALLVSVASERVASAGAGPTTWTQTTILQGGHTYQSPLFGSVMAFDGDVALVGASLDFPGSVYVYSRSGALGSWTQVARLTADDDLEGSFGYSVALSGKRAVIGASHALYVFERQDSTASWKRTAKLTGFGLGGPVVLAGDTLFAGRSQTDLTGKSSGQVDVFSFDGAGWKLASTLKPADLPPGGLFGASLAMQGSLLVVGAPRDVTGGSKGAAYVFSGQGTAWTQRAKLAAGDAQNNFGMAVATDGSRVLVGSPFMPKSDKPPTSAAYLFEDDGSKTWAKMTEFTVPSLESPTFAPLQLGAAVGISSERLFLGAPGAFEPSTGLLSGALVECRPGDGKPWDCSRVTYPSTVQDGQLFGQALALNPGFPQTALVGAPSTEVDGVAQAGAVFEYGWGAEGGPLVQLARGVSDDGNRQVGVSVSIDGDTAVVGAPAGLWGGGLKDAGSVYVYHRQGSVWSEQARLFAADPQASAAFGNAVSISGDLIVVGAFLKRNPGEQGADGAVYIFEKSGDSWTQSATFASPEGDGSGFFGVSVSASSSLLGKSVVVGASKGNPNGVPSAGLAYVFAKADAGWQQQARLVAPDAQIADAFGSSVSMALSTLAVGAPEAAVGGKAQAGKVYLFRRTGSSWDYWDTLQAADGAQFDAFGASVSHTAGSVIVGAPKVNNSSGAAYVFDLGEFWTETAKFSGTQPGDAFGTSVSIVPGAASVGAPNRTFAQKGKGAVYLFTRQGSGWSAPVLATPQNNAIYPFGGTFGSSVSLSPLTLGVAVGSPAYGVANQSPAYVLMPGAANGAACGAVSDCASGFCVDGVCCNVACGDGADDCQACSVAKGGTLDGTCTPLKFDVAPTKTCRASAGECDVAEACSTSFRECLPDLFQPEGTSCADGVCSAGVCGAASAGAGGASGAAGSGGASAGSAGSGGSEAGGSSGAGGAGGGAGGAGSAGGSAGGAGGSAGDAGSAGAPAGSGGSAGGSGGKAGASAAGAAGSSAGAAGAGGKAGAAGKGGAAGAGGASGASGASAGGKAGAAGKASGGATTPASSGGDSGGCSVQAGPAPSSFGLLAVSLLGLFARRRAKSAE